jgi:hypothetical protein
VNSAVIISIVVAVLIIVVLPLALLMVGRRLAERPDLAQVKIIDNEVRIIPVGLMRRFALNNEVRLDRREIRRAVDVDRSELPARGHRTFGTGMPGLAAGRYRSGTSGASFWLVGRAPRLLLIDMDGGPLAYVVLQVRDPGQLAGQLHEPVRD